MSSPRQGDRRELTTRALAVARSAVIGCVVALVAGCPPLWEHHRNDDRRIGARAVTGTSFNRRQEGTAQSDAEGARALLLERADCDEREELLVHRRGVTTRKTNIPVAIVSYVGAALGLGLGIGVLANIKYLKDVRVQTGQDPDTYGPMGRAGVYSIGGIALTSGMAALGIGIGTSARGRDTVVDIGTIRVPVADSKKARVCVERPIEGAKLVLAIGQRKVEAGVTDATGRLKVPWAVLRSVTVDGALPEVGHLETATGTALSDVDLRPARAYWAQKFLASAAWFAEVDEIDQAQKSADRARSLGADVVEVAAKIKAAPTSVKREKEAEEKATANRERWQGLWGDDFAEWAGRPGVRPTMAALAALSRRLAAAYAAHAEHEEEKTRNDARVVAPSAVRVPLFPETQGAYVFIKILDRGAGEALFEATDGLFVLHLSPGDSFNPVPGGSVRMTMHSRGQSVLMTTGRRLPVFWSGSSPGRVRATPGFRPSRAREQRLQARARALDRDAQSATARLLKTASPKSDWVYRVRRPPAGIEVTVTLRNDGPGVGEIRMTSPEGDAGYCIQASSCGDKGRIVPVEDFLRAH